MSTEQLTPASADPRALLPAGLVLPLFAGALFTGALLLLSWKLALAALDFGVLHQDLDLLVPGEDADDLAVDPRDRRELAGPVGEAVRPGQPGRPVGHPLRGHRVAK